MHLHTLAFDGARYTPNANKCQTSQSFALRPVQAARDPDAVFSEVFAKGQRLAETA